ncbi:MAG: hypothetical protein QM479_11085 [Pseudomonadota bacterium]
MTPSVSFKISKELQIKLRPELAITNKRAQQTIIEVLTWLEANSKLKWKQSSGELWQRRGERYDTKRGFFKANKLTLATEKSKDDKNRTKLKCKAHNFMPELLYPSIKESYCFPSAGSYQNIKLKFKQEQDIHFNNCKYCATGYMKLPGTQHKFKHIKDFFPYYPNLKNIPNIDANKKLVKVKDWQESIFDDIEMSIGDFFIKGALVTRRDYDTGILDESEFSFKVAATDEQWDYEGLLQLGEIYNLVRDYYGDIFFISQPSIFTFQNPVSSQAIKEIFIQECWAT